MEQGTTRDILAERGGAALDIERLERLIAAFKTAMNCTPSNVALPERVRLALGGLPDWCVQEMQANARAFTTLTELRLAEGAPGE